MPNDPKYVRITDPVRRPGTYDLTSGWSITGKDVKPFPTDPDQARYVRSKIRDNVLEPCSRAEYEEVQEGNAKMAALASGSSHQEHRLWEREQATAAAAAVELASDDIDGDVDDDDPEDDDTSQDDSDANDEDGEGSDDSDQKEEEKPPAKKAAPKKSAAKTKKVAKKKK